MTEVPSKMKLLNERWQEIQREIEREKHFKQQTIQQQLSSLEARLNQQRPFFTNKTQLLNQKLQKTKNQLKHLHSFKEEKQAQFNKKLQALEEAFIQQIQIQKRKREESVEAWIKQADEKLLFVCEQTAQIIQDKSQQMDEYNVKIEKRIQELKEKILFQKGIRQQLVRETKLKYERQINRLTTKIQQQKKIREEKNKNISKLIQEVHHKLCQQIEQQRRLRKQTTNALLQLLQETCLKVQKAFD